MISSRWPRPIGVIASMALMPVCSGSCTGLRPVMPGACTSRRRSWSCAIGPLPSIGTPSAFTTRPSSASPTATERMRPVAVTVMPSSTLVGLAEDDRADRLLFEVQREAERAALELEQLVDRRVRADPRRARCRRRPRAPGRPAPARSTGWKPSTCFAGPRRCRPALIVSSASLASGSLPSDLSPSAARAGGARCRRSRCRRCVATMPPMHLLVDDDLHLDLLAGRRAQRLGEPLHLRVVERHRGAHLGDLVLARRRPRARRTAATIAGRS